MSLTSYRAAPPRDQGGRKIGDVRRHASPIIFRFAIFPKSGLKWLLSGQFKFRRLAEELDRVAVNHLVDQVGGPAPALHF